MAMRWVFFLLMVPILLASDKVAVKNLELKILNGAKNGAGYVSVYNGNTYAITLYKVEVTPNVFDRVELHDHVPRKDENGSEYMEMIEIPEMEISPGSTLFLQPGGKHLMLMNLKSTLCSYKKLLFKFFFRCGKNSFLNTLEVDVPKNKRCE
jgi:copper(I)-binding protein